MKILGKMFTALMLLTYITTSTYAAYESVSCDSNADFTANSCNECFAWGTAAVWDNKGLLTDVWKNNSENAQVLFKEEQEMPSMIALGSSSWKEIKASDSVDFWQYTSDLDALYNEDHLGYTLEAGNSVTWIESTLGSAYNLESSSVAKWDNVGMIVYDIATHNIDATGTPALDKQTHRECVLYTSWDEADTPVVPENPELPQTGPEHIFLALAALLLGFGVLRFRKKA